jgi:hypothetical protein
VVPLLLLDVDGVLNAVAWGSDRGTWGDWRRGTAVADGRSWPIQWSPSVVDAVLRWQAQADVRWLTTWGHDANRGLRELLGLPELPVAGTYDEPAGDPDPGLAGTHAAVTPAARDALTGRWWKFDVVRRLLRETPGRPLVWIDDDLAGQQDLRRWVQEATAALLVAPPPRVGLRPQDLAEVDAFLLRSGAPAGSG